VIRTTRPRAIRAVALAAGVAFLGGVLALTGCSAGQITQTSSQVAGVNGVSARVGSIVVRDAQIEFAGAPGDGSAYPRGSDAPLKMAIINEGNATDRLVSASSPVATSVLILGDTSLPPNHTLSVGNLRGPTAVRLPDTNQVQIILFNIKQDLKPGGITYEVVLVFEKAGAVRLQLPVGNPDESGGSAS
jgi:copper(I)-binding protein